MTDPSLLKKRWGSLCLQQACNVHRYPASMVLPGQVNRGIQGGGRGPGGMGGTWDSKASCQLQQKASTHAFTHAFTHTPLLLTAPASPPFRTQEQQKIQLEQQKLQLEQQKLQLQQQQQQQERMQQRPGGGAMAGGGASRREARHNPFMSEDGTADPPPAFTVILC